jgi:cell division protein FtsW (lipid II flippase)
VGSGGNAAAALTPRSTAAVPRPLSGRRSELLVLVFAVVITAVALLIVNVEQQQPLGRGVFEYATGYLALLIGTRLVIRRVAPHADPLLLPVVAVLNGLGLVMIHRLDLSDGQLVSGAAHGDGAIQQTWWTIFGVLAFCLTLTLLKDHRALSRYSYLCGMAGLVLLVLPALLPDALSEQNGAKIWIRLSGFSIEPGEVAKILLVVFAASVLAERRDLFASAGRRALGVYLPRPRDLAPLLAVLIVSIGVMVFETDLGASLLVFATFLAMVYIATRRVSWVTIGLVLFAAASLVAYQLFGHVRIRVQNWVNPFADPDGVGYQMVQAQFGFASGGVLGTGLGAGEPGAVPIASSDFIIAAIGEELGLVGLAAVLMLYTILIMRSLRTAIAVRDAFGKLLAGGLSCTLAFQLFLVVGGVTNLIPQTGLTTPWISYGGSSLIANYVLLALIVRISDTARRSDLVRPGPQTPIASASTDVIGRIQTSPSKRATTRRDRALPKSLGPD